MVIFDKCDKLKFFCNIFKSFIFRYFCKRRINCCVFTFFIVRCVFYHFDKFCIFKRITCFYLNVLLYAPGMFCK